MPPKRIASEKPTKWVTRSGLLLGLLLAVPLSAHAQDASWERFQLYTRCAGMRMSATLQDSDDDLDSLTVRQIEQSVRSRLRAARLYRETSGFALRIYVSVVRQAYGLGLHFYKPLDDPVSGLRARAITWEASYTCMAAAPIM